MFVTSAVESDDNRVLAIFEKHHSKEDFRRAASLCKNVGLTLNPTFVAFTPWISLEVTSIYCLQSGTSTSSRMSRRCSTGYVYSYPRARRLLELEDVQDIVGDFDEAALCLTWAHEDPEVDRLQQRVMDFVADSDAGRHEILEQVRALAGRALHGARARLSVARRGAGSSGPDNSVYRAPEGEGARHDSLSHRALVVLSGATEEQLTPY